MLQKLQRLLLALAWLAAFSAAGAVETNRDAALGLAGEVYLAHSGTCGQLFDHCSETGNALLAVDIVRSGEDPVRLRVPGTDGPEVEGTPALLFEDASSSLFVVWESKLQPNQSQVNLTWYDGEQWAPEVIEISGDVHPLKGPPQVLITRDRYEVGLDDEQVSRRQRTVVHVVWWEQGPEAEQVYYTPIILEDGAYIGRNHVYDLSALDPGLPPEEPTSLSPELLRSPVIEAGRDEATTLVAFTNPESERFVVFEVRLLPGELSLLADELQREILRHPELFNPEGIEELADRARGHMIEFGHRLHPGLLQLISDDTAMVIRTYGLTAAADVEELADRARGHMIEFGARTLGTGGLTAEPASSVALTLETRKEAAEPPVVEPPPAHHLWLRLVSDRPAPEVGDHPVWIFLSEDGRDAVVSWENNGKLLYRETTPEGWTGVRRISLQGPVDAARAEQILRQRVRER